MGGPRRERKYMERTVEDKLEESIGKWYRHHSGVKYMERTVEDKVDESLGKRYISPKYVVNLGLQ